MDPVNRSMLPSMPSISTPFKSQCLDDMEDLLPIQPCISTNFGVQSVAADSMRCTITTHSLSFKDVFSSIQSSTVQSSPHITINLPPTSISGRVTPPKISDSNIISACQKKSSPFKLVTPILKKYNSQRSGKCIQKPSTPTSVSTSSPPESPSVVQSSSLSYTSVTPAGCSKSDELNKPVCVNENGQDNEDELAALMAASTTIPRCPKRKQPHVVSKAKRLKELREAQVMLSMLDPDTDEVKEETSNNFAQEFFNAMKEYMEENDDLDLFQEVLVAMSEFDVNITPVTEFYNKITSLLVNYPELSEQFVAFLLPDQALECGKFMDYQKIMNMRNFVKQLKIFFAKQPQQLRFVFASLEKLAQRESLSMEEIKTTILPLLRGNSLLVNNFLMLLPQERPPESMMTEFEDLEIDSDHSGNEDEMLSIPDQLDPYGRDSCVCSCHDSLDEKLRSRFSHCVSCGTKFIHGKVYLQIGRSLRPAKVAFPGYPNQTKRLYIKVFPKIRGRRNVESVTKGIQVSPNSNMNTVEISDDPKIISPKSSRTSKAKTKSRASISKCTQTVNTNKTAAHVRNTASKASASTTTHEVTSLPSRKSALSPSNTTVSNKTAIPVLSSPSVGLGLLDNKEMILLSDPSVTILNVLQDVADPQIFPEENKEYIAIETYYGSGNSDTKLNKLDFSFDFLSASGPSLKDEYIPVENACHNSYNPEISSTVTSFNCQVASDSSIINNEYVPLGTHFVDKYVVTSDTPITFQSNSDVTEHYNSVATAINSNSEICHENTYLSHNLEYNPAENDEYISMDAYFEETCVLIKDVPFDHSVEDENMNCSSTTEDCKPPLETDTSITNAASPPCSPSGESSSLVTTSTVESTADIGMDVMDLESRNAGRAVCSPGLVRDPAPSTSTDVGNSPSNDSTGRHKSVTGKKTPRPWTKDEDKVILLEVQRGYCLDKTFQNIQGLPQRSLKEICERFHVLMKMLQEMTVPKEENSSSSSSSTF